MWEVYSGSGHLAETMESYGRKAQRFDYNTGWGFEDAQHRREFFHHLNLICPDFVRYASQCRVWSPLQNLNVDTPERHKALMADRAYQKTPISGSATRAMSSNDEKVDIRLWSSHERSHPGRPRRSLDSRLYDANFDQCQYGCTLPDEHRTPQYITRSAAQMTGWLSVFPTPAMAVSTIYLSIEGSSPGIGLRVKRPLPRTTSSNNRLTRTCPTSQQAVVRIHMPHSRSRSPATLAHAWSTRSPACPLCIGPRPSTTES